MNKILLVVLLVMTMAHGKTYRLVCEDVLKTSLGSDFRYELRTTGGSGKYGYEIDGLPAGLKAQGPVIAGIPKALGKYPIVIRSYDDQGNFDIKNIVMNVASSDASSSSSTSSGTIGGGNLFGSTFGSFGSLGTSGTSTGGSTTSSTTSETVTVTSGSTGSSSTSGTTGTAFSDDISTLILGGLTTGSNTFETTSSTTGTSGTTGSTGTTVTTFSPSTTTGTSGATTSSTTTGASAPSGPFGPTGSTTTSGQTTISTTTTRVISSGVAPSVGYAPSYPTGPTTAFPTQKFPTGTSPNFTPSSLPSQISNYQYTVDTNRDTVQPTQLDIQNSAIFQRQIAAGKTVANVLAIVTRLTANVNGVQADIPAATTALNQAIAEQRTVQQRIVNAENANKTLTANIAKVRTEISTFQQTLSKLSADIKGNQGLIDANATTKAAIDSNLADATSRLGPLQQALANANEARTKTQAAITGINEDIAKYTTQITNIQRDIDNAPSSAQLADIRVKQLTDTITTLEEQLNKLRAERDEFKKKSDYFKSVPITGGAQLRQIQSTITTMTSQLRSVHEPALVTANSNIQKINADIATLQSLIADLNSKSRQIDVAIASANRNRDGFSGQYRSIVTEITRSTTVLNSLESQLPAFNNALVQAYNDGNDINDRVARHRQVLDSLNLKYVTSLKELSDAQGALERARAEKEIADIAVNERIRAQGGRTILPFAIPGASFSTSTVVAPTPVNGRFSVSGSGLDAGSIIGSTTLGIVLVADGAGSQGTVTGNAPNGGFIISGLGGTVGSTLGTTTSGATIISGGGGITVSRPEVSAVPGRLTGDLTHYISSSLSNGVSSQVLYPFIMSWGRSVNLPAFDCSAESAERSATISSINPDSLTVTSNDGSSFDLKVGSCTQLRANKQNYQPAVGDRAVWRGVSGQNSRVINASSLSCFA